MFQRQRNLLFFYAMIVALAMCGAQQSQTGLKGKVVDKYEHVPIHNVFVLIHRRNGDDHARTDPAGMYEIKLPPGTYDVFFSAEGFSPACRKIEVKPQKMTKFDVILEVNTLGMEAD